MGVTSRLGPAVLVVNYVALSVEGGVSARTSLAAASRVSAFDSVLKTGLGTVREVLIGSGLVEVSGM